MNDDGLNLTFINKTDLDEKQVFISFLNHNLGSKDFTASYQNGTPVPFAATTDLMSTPLSLKEIGEDGFFITQAIGIVVYVSYGAPLASRTSAPAYIGGGTDFDVQFQTFELTCNGNPGDQGDLTAINYFTAPLRIESFGTEATPLQSVGYTRAASEIGNTLFQCTRPEGSALAKTADGSLLRYIGPSSYGQDSNPYPSFIGYLQAVNAAGQTTAISNSNAFNVPSQGGPGSINYNFTLNLVATAAADGSIDLNGSVTTDVTPYGQPSAPGESFNNCTVHISATDPQSFNDVIYGQATNSAVTFTGSGWQDFATYIEQNGLTGQGVEMTTKNLLIGEITSGLLLGLVNSDIIPAGQTQKLKDMTSREWWHLDPLPAFAEAQPDNTYYDPYAGVIFAASNNEVYSIPYSDRLGNGPLVNSVSYNGTTVERWEVTLLPPLPTPI
ncbi:hypothetical protein J2858_002912 [Neorhizobium galegae]|uniref:hypothetical protein n=1 Tax=Neorhizobium galegae TaxID=399 RepID=UPI001AE7E295|nr:hypothetical protein [Neorhizobium galegae]MBP2549979.1 hypothetical protein [Neorhizobium galegae]